MSAAGHASQLGKDILTAFKSTDIAVVAPGSAACSPVKLSFGKRVNPVSSPYQVVPTGRILHQFEAAEIHGTISRTGQGPQRATFAPVL